MRAVLICTLLLMGCDDGGGPKVIPILDLKDAAMGTPEMPRDRANKSLTLLESNR